MEGAIDQAVTPSPPEGTRRRSVQTKLCFGVPKSQGENAKEIGEIGAGKAAESPKKRRGRRKATAESSTKAPVIDDVETELTTTKNDDVVPEVKVETNEKPKGRRRVKSEISAKSPNLKRARPGSGTPKKDDEPILEDSPGKRQRRGVKVVPCSKRCKALESICEGVEGLESDSHKEVTIDLRSEAKLAAEENSRLSRGKQMHPFFASRTTIKRTAETVPDYAKLEDENSTLPQENGLSLCPPIHVHDSSQGDVMLNWGRWTFKKSSSLDKNHLPLETSCSVFEDSVKPLTLGSGISMEMHHHQFSVNAIAIPNNQLCSEFVHVDDGNSSFLPSCSSSSLIDLTENEIEVSNESCLPLVFLHANVVRKDLLSFQKDSSLWTDKYCPKNASEVCGNSKSVSLLSEWLMGWHEKGRKSNIISKSTEDISEDSCSSWYKSESDVDDLPEESDSWNSLVITGPVGSGKSAAVYACAKEQGFNIVEVNASDLRNGAHVRQKFGEATESHGLGKWSRKEMLVSSTPDSTPRNGTVRPVAVNKTLVLFEDADTVFEEDRGFISTILQLARSTKWPIVLTTNNEKPVLPRHLSRLVLEFNRPSSAELLLHVQKICTLEKAGIPVSLMKHAIDYCLSDIRRTIMLLQFWCQGSKNNIGNEGNCGSIPLDTDAMHSAIPIAFPHEFPCELSKKICTEIDQTISSIEEHELQKELEHLRFLTPEEPSPSKPKRPNKKSKLRRNQSIPESPGVEQCSSDLNDFSDVPNTPIPTVKKSSRNRRALVMSDSEDDPCADRLTLDNTTLSQDCTPLEVGILIDNAMDPFECDGSATPSHVCDTFVSVIPESPYTSKDATVSKKGNTFYFDWPSGDANVDTPNYMYLGTHANADAPIGNYSAMDECSCVGFNFKDTSSRPIQSVEDTWKNLRNRHEELKASMRSDSKMASLVLKAAHQLVDLISQTDVLVTGCNPLIYDMLDQSFARVEEPDGISSYDIQLEMGAAYAQHGLGFYIGSFVACEKRADLAQEMLKSSGNSAAIGRLLTMNIAREEILHECFAQNKLSSSFTQIQQQQHESSLYSAISAIVPPKLALSLRGPSFHEYLSSTSQISKLEFSRLSQNEFRSSNRRSRQSRHYLTMGKLQLSPEDAELLALCNSHDGNR